jgi:hypothetical protein
MMVSEAEVTVTITAMVKAAVVTAVAAIVT